MDAQADAIVVDDAAYDRDDWSWIDAMLEATIGVQVDLLDDFLLSASVSRMT